MRCLFFPKFVFIFYTLTSDKRGCDAMRCDAMRDIPRTSSPARSSWPLLRTVTALLDAGGVLLLCSAKRPGDNLEAFVADAELADFALEAADLVGDVHLHVLRRR